MDTDKDAPACQSNTTNHRSTSNLSGQQPIEGSNADQEVWILRMPKQSDANVDSNWRSFP